MTSRTPVLIFFVCHINLSHYIIVRSDLPLGILAAQITHAAGESIKEELPANTNAVVLAVKNETELRLIAKKLALKGIPHILVRESDPPFENQCMAIGVVPLSDRSLVKPILSELKLLRTLEPCKKEEAP